jgi:hypothetical protein
VAAAAAALVVAAGVLAIPRVREAGGRSAAQTWKVTLNPPAGLEFAPVGTFNMATPEVSPDGSMVVAVIGDMLYLRRMNGTRFVQLHGTENGNQVFWSPDSQWIGYTYNGKLFKMQVPEGAPDPVTDVSIYIKGATWNAKGEILMAADGLRIVPASGGPAVPLTKPGEKGMPEAPFWPHYLPDGEHFVFSARDPNLPEDANAERGIYLAAWSGGKWTQRPVLLKSNLNEARYSSMHGGCLLYVQNDNLYAQKLNVAEGKLEGVPELVQTQIATSVDLETSHFSVSNNGVLAWRHGKAVLSQLTWFDREGKVIGTTGPPGSYFRVEISPDGKHVATVSLWGEVPEYRIMESGEAASLRIARATRDVSIGGGIVWSHDSAHLYYRTKKASDAGPSLVEHEPNSSAQARVISPVPDGFPTFIDDISPDLKQLLYWQETLFIVPLGQPAAPPVPLEASDRTFLGMFSPDGRWVVYQSGSSKQVFVQKFPDAGQRKQISEGAGGSMPFWRDDGKEILYLSEDHHLWSVPVNLARGEFGAARRLFAVKPPPLTRVTRIYAATRDGSRILFSQIVDQPESEAINVAVDWEAGIRK